MELSKNKKWRSLNFKAMDLEDAGAWCIEHGASGTSFGEDSELTAYFHITDQEREALSAAARQAGLLLISEALIEERNWVQECREVWTPLTIGSITLTPFLSAESTLSPAAPNEVRLIPGFGFGTGHHATTAMVLLEIQRIVSRNPSITQTLDVGTGSGVLAITLALLSKKPTIAFDTDFGALENARDNVALNQLGSLVHLLCSDISAVRGRFEIVVANLYAEVLESIRDSLIARLAPGGFLVLSGISEPLHPRVRSHFAAAGLMLASEDVCHGWGMLSFTAP